MRSDFSDDVVIRQRRKRHISLKGSRRLRKEEYWNEDADVPTFQDDVCRMQDPEIMEVMRCGIIKGRSI